MEFMWWWKGMFNVVVIVDIPEGIEGFRNVAPVVVRDWEMNHE